MELKQFILNCLAFDWRQVRPSMLRKALIAVIVTQ